MWAGVVTVPEMFFFFFFLTSQPPANRPEIYLILCIKSCYLNTPTQPQIFRGQPLMFLKPTNAPG